jgi:chromosome segregation ATPase
VQKLLDTPFLFVLNGDIYENFPNLRTLNDEITALKQNQIETQQSIQKMQKLCRDMKEQLILLGQNTMDPYLRDLESQITTQLRLLEQSQNLLQMSTESQQEQLKLQEELLKWAELDRLRQQASQISGEESKRDSWQKMTTLELQAAELAFQMHDLNQKLRNTLSLRSAENETL